MYLVTFRVWNKLFWAEIDIAAQHTEEAYSKLLNEMDKLNLPLGVRGTTVQLVSFKSC